MNRPRSVSIVCIATMVVCALEVNAAYLPSVSHHDATCRGYPASVVGTKESDELQGTTGPDVIAAGAGSDLVEALDGDDLLCGGADSDDLRGGSGADVISGGVSADALSGNTGDDRLHGITGTDLIEGGRGADHLRGQRSPDLLVGGFGRSDVCRGGEPSAASDSRDHDLARSCERTRGARELKASSPPLAPNHG